jgi:hypothetical protein
MNLTGSSHPSGEKQARKLRNPEPPSLDRADGIAHIRQAIGNVPIRALSSIRGHRAPSDRLNPAHAAEGRYENSGLAGRRLVTPFVDGRPAKLLKARGSEPGWRRKPIKNTS